MNSTSYKYNWTKYINLMIYSSDYSDGMRPNLFNMMTTNVRITLLNNFSDLNGIFQCKSYK